MENVKNGGAGSGDFNHAGNPPHVGGSEPIESRISRGFGKHKAEKTEKKEEKSKEQKNRETQANYGKKIIDKETGKKGTIIGSVPRGTNPDTKKEMYLYEIKWDNGEIERKHSNKVEIKDDKEDYKSIIEKLDKKYGVDKNDKGESWYDRASEKEIKTDIKTLEHEIDKNNKEIDRLKNLSEDIAKRIVGGKDKKIKGLQEQIKRDKEHIIYAKAHLEKKKEERVNNSLYKHEFIEY